MKDDRTIKKCKGCSLDKTIECFYKKPSGRYGVEAYCTECRSKIRADQYLNNKVVILERVKKYCRNNKEQIKERDALYYQKNRGAILKNKAVHYIENREQIKEKKSEYYYKNKARIQKSKKKYYEKNKETVRARDKKYYHKNRTKILERAVEYNKKNAGKIAEYKSKNKDRIQKVRRIHYLENIERLRAISRKYNMENKGAIKIKRQKILPFLRKKERERYRSDTFFRLNQNMRAGIYNALKQNKGGRRWETLVGFSLKDLKNHLIKLMRKYNKSHPNEKDMTWDNYGEWQIDHIIPKKVFNFTKPEHEDFKRCWSLPNLQPLWARDNLAKRAKIDKPFQPQLALG